MKKKTVAIILAMVAALMLGAYGMYVVYDNMFPIASPIKQIESSMLEMLSMCDNEGDEIILSDMQLQELVAYINDAVPTRIMSVNDYPGVRPYYVVEIKTDERVFRYMLYEENGITYAEIPYEGIYEIDREAVEFMKD